MSGRERPILFSAPMVRALLAGTKTQTRRVVKAEPPPGAERVIRPFHDERLQWAATDPHDMEQGQLVLGEAPRCPYGAPGDRLWVREAYRLPASLDALSPAAVGDKALDAGYSRPWCPTQFEADGARRTDSEWRTFGSTPGGAVPGKLRPGIHMPRWASRITLEVTGVRVERLQDISCADAMAEGIERHPQHEKLWMGDPPTPGLMPHYVAAYRALWESINGPGSWDANPWVWVVEFKRVEPA